MFAGLMYFSDLALDRGRVAGIGSVRGDGSAAGSVARAAIGITGQRHRSTGT